MRVETRNRAQRELDATKPKRKKRATVIVAEQRPTPAEIRKREFVKVNDQGYCRIDSIIVAPEEVDG